MTRRNMLISTGAFVLGGCKLFKNTSTLDPERVGVCSWSFQQPLDSVAVTMGRLGIRRIHLALQPFLAEAAGEGRHGAAEGVVALENAKHRIASGQWKLSATMVGFPQEDYSTLETIRKTGGVVPDSAWEANRKIVKSAAHLSAELHAPFLSLHGGFLDETSPTAYAKYVDRIKCLRDICGEEGVKLILESGQETAEDLARFLPAVDGVGVNFDPANMILYGKGDPVKAISHLAPWIKHVHIKDAKVTQVPGTWGTETPWGDGEVDQAAFLAALDAAGYEGAFAVEREGGNNRVADISTAVNRLTGKV